MVLSVKDIVLDAVFCEYPGQELGFIDIYRTDKYRLTFLMSFLDRLEDSRIFAVLGLEHSVNFIDTLNRLVRRNYDDIEETGFGYTVVEYNNTKYSAVLMDVPEVKVNEYSDTVEELGFVVKPERQC